MRGAWDQILSLGVWHWNPVYSTVVIFLAVLVSVLLLLDLQLEASAGEHAFAAKTYSWRIVTGLAFCVLITLFGANQENAFIYFRF